MKFRTKQQVREYVWRRIEPFSTFPPPYNRIPNFRGAEKACERVKELEEWEKAEVVFSAPDSPLRRLRELCLEQGKMLVMAKPHMKGLVAIDPEKRVRGTLKELLRAGREMDWRDLPEVDLFVQGCVAVDLAGNRIGKGKGYEDREYSMLKDVKCFVVVCHELQVFDDLSYLCEEHDVKCDVILTPERVIRCR